MSKKERFPITIMEAVDNLSSMAEMDIEEVEEMQVNEGVRLHGIQWIDPRDRAKTLDTVKGTFRAVHEYLEHIYKKDKQQLKEIEMQKGIQSIMQLADEAAEKMDRCSSLFKRTYEESSVSHLKEYQDLKEFYLNKITKRFEKVLEKEEAWQQEWEQIESNVLDIERVGLKDLETVKRDRQYELFSILDEEGNPFFNRNLLRHIKLVSNFDEVIQELEGDDPLLRIKLVQDKQMHDIALEVKEKIAPVLKKFYKNALKHKEIKIVMLMNKVIMALFLAANHRNLLQNASGKSCIKYFEDFQCYLREFMGSGEYQRLIALSQQQRDPLMTDIISLIHMLCYHFFNRMATPQEMIGFIYQLIEKKGVAKKIKNTSKNSVSFWNKLLDDHEVIRSLLLKYPNGPLFKTLDVFKNREAQEGFDPIGQGNMPCNLYKLKHSSYKTDCLRIPCPTSQEKINQAEVIPEFSGLLRYYSSNKKVLRHLLINLQDRTSWQEHSRCQVLEEMQKKAEFTKSLVVVTLPKNTDFYLQTSDYLKENNAKSFMKQLKDQVESGEACGFYFPPSIVKKEIRSFVTKIVSLIHKTFFSEKNVLSRRNRLDFIEIFYFFLTLKLLDILRPDSFSFTCKDALDIGGSMNGGFYAFIKLLGNQFIWEEKEKDFLLWMFFGPPLLIRERAVDLQRLHRTISALSVLSAELEIDRKGVTSSLENLYDFPSINKFHADETL